jgi:Secretion system C-terminal sorting domain
MMNWICFKYSFITLLLVSGMTTRVSAQLEKVIIEKYYVSDEFDATDTTGGVVLPGTVTYRVYADLVPGSVLMSMYGDEGHPIYFHSDSVFFNHTADGQSFAKEFIRTRYMENLVALDTWLTLGQTAKKQGNNTFYGVLKDQDDDGSFIGGTNNDGGSDAVAAGLLVNEDPSCGLPLTISDGMDTLNYTPTGWFSNGILDFVSGNDSTIFGSLVPGNEYYSENMSLSSSGVYGVVADSNQVLVAQLTTRGEIEFILNFEVEYFDGNDTILTKYVGTNNITNADEVYNPYLSYPYDCGCNDPEFLEYDPSFICLEEGSCITPLVIGCTDSLACNYDPSVNFNVPALCCYPGWCSNRNIEEVCPQLMGASFDFSIYPNPTSDYIILQLIQGEEENVEYAVYNSYGVKVFEKSIEDAPLNLSERIEMSTMTPGIYQIRVKTAFGEKNQLFVKL